MMPLGSHTDVFHVLWILIFLRVWTSSNPPVVELHHKGDTISDIRIMTWDGWVIF